MVDRNACPAFHSAVELIGRRWNGVIVDLLLAGGRRFSELQAAIPDITPAMLSQRLKELETALVVHRQVSAGRPVEVSYSLTATGRELSTVLDAVAQWSLGWEGHENVTEVAPVIRRKMARVGS